MDCRWPWLMIEGPGMLILMAKILDLLFSQAAERATSVYLVNRRVAT